jgi:hypothetical protein
MENQRVRAVVTMSGGLKKWFSVTTQDATGYHNHGNYRSLRAAEKAAKALNASNIKAHNDSEHSHTAKVS